MSKTKKISIDTDTLYSMLTAMNQGNIGIHSLTQATIRGWIDEINDESESPQGEGKAFTGIPATFTGVYTVRTVTKSIKLPLQEPFVRETISYGIRANSKEEAMQHVLNQNPHRKGLKFSAEKTADLT